MTRGPSKAAQRREALAAWWRRDPWPCVLLVADPGAMAGASVILSGPDACHGLDVEHPVGRLVHVAEVDTMSLALEATIDVAVDVADAHDLPVVLVLEEWGRGGPLGIDQWIGLGASRGAWRRAYVLEAKKQRLHAADSAVRCTQGRVVHIGQTEWRSRCLPETGLVHPVMGWRPFLPDEWKAAAARAAARFFEPSSCERLASMPNAAEAVCMGAFAARSDDVGKVLSKTHLARFGMQYPPIEAEPRVRRRRRVR